MRLAVHLLAGFLLSCGQSPQNGARENNRGNAEVSIELPPPLPPENKAQPPLPRDAAADAAMPDLEPSSSSRMVRTSPPIAAASLAGHIAKAGFDCDEVVATSQMERDGRRAGIFRFDCTAGGSYQGTMKSGHLYFRPWRGTPRPD